MFPEQGAGLYQSANVLVLSDKQATGDAIRTAFAELASQIAAQDVFVLYLTGHGASFDREYPSCRGMRPILRPPRCANAA